MKKILFSLIILTLVLSLSTKNYSFDIEVIAQTLGNEQPAGTLYFPIAKDTKIITGISAILPGSKSKATDLDLHLGISSPVPYLGLTETILNFNKWAPNVQDGSQTGTSLHLDSVLIRKNYLFELTDEVDIGFQAILAEIMLQGDKMIKVFPGIYPVISATISFP